MIDYVNINTKPKKAGLSFGKILFTAVLLYSFFHFGRWFEYQNTKKVIYNAITPNKYIKYNNSNCIDNAKIDGLFDYIQLDH